MAEPATLAPPRIPASLLAAPARFGWAEAARAALAAGPCALVTLLAIEGSAPLGPGARMVVTEAGLIAGSIGGGALEQQTIGQARAILAHPAGTWRVQDYPLGPLLGQCCGGRVRLLVERLDPDHADWLEGLLPGMALSAAYTEHCVRRILLPGHRCPPPMGSTRTPKPQPGDILGEPLAEPPRTVLLFGAGHVGQAIVRVLQPLPFALRWYDSRAEYARIGACVLSEEDLAGTLAEAPSGAAVLVLTHDHALDYALTKAALSREDFALVGVIGSLTKRARFLSRLARDGITDAPARLTCPIGVDGIAGKDPGIIAVSVAAQLLMLSSANPEGHSC